MVFSGTTTFNLTAQQICTMAASKLKIVDTSAGEVLDTQTYTDFLQQLNVIVKREMSVKGVLPWVRAYNTLILQQGQTTYSLGPTSTDNWTLTSGLVPLTLATGAGSGAGSIQVSSIARLSNGMFIGITLTSGLKFWTTINGAPSGSMVTLTSPLPSAAASGNYVYAYTAVADRPQKILDMVRHNTSGQDVRMDPISLEEYMTLPNKTQNGTPLQWNFANKIPNAELKLWQPYDGLSGWDTLNTVCDTIIEDFVNTTDNPYFPVEWCDYLVFQLAYQMAFTKPVSKVDRDDLKALAAEFHDDLLDYSSQLAEESLKIGLRHDGPA